MPVSASNSMLAVPPPMFCASIRPDVVEPISRRVNGIGSSATSTPSSAVGSLNDSLSTITTLTSSSAAGSRFRLIRPAAATYRAAIRAIAAAL